MRKLIDKVFGFSPDDLPTYAYNSIVLIIGAFCITHTLSDFLGVVFIGEAFLASIERCWPKSELPKE